VPGTIPAVRVDLNLSPFLAKVGRGGLGIQLLCRDPWRSAIGLLMEGETDMAEKEAKITVKKEAPTPPSHTGLLDWHPLETLRRQINRLFEELPAPTSISPFEPFDRLIGGFPATPAVDFVEKEKEYEITAELPGLDDKNVEVKLSNGMLIIGGEKRKRGKKRRKATTSLKGVTALSNAPSASPRASMRTKSRPRSTRAC
jgi:hypothetical protein